jgi:non-ribosomal peptide synthetase component F
MVKESSVVNIMQWFGRELVINPASRVLCLTTFCFDISVLEIYLPLVFGGTIVLAQSTSQKDPFTLLQLISRTRVTVFQATPTTYELMLATGWAGDMKIDFLVGGEAFRPSLLPLIGACRSLRNVYGPTETTIWSSCSDISALVMGEGSGPLSVPIGLPISATNFYIVVETDGIDSANDGRKRDQNNVKFRLAAAGEEGELWIGGVGVAAGYLNAPVLTAAVFVPNPFDAVSSPILYRTGDIVRRLEVRIR